MRTAHRHAVPAGPLTVHPDGIRAGAVFLGAPAPPPRTLWQILETTAAACPRAAAIDDGRSVLRYQGLLREARRIGDLLAARGIGAGDRVGIRIPSGTAELYLSILAVLSIGAAYVPVDVDDPDDRAELVWSEAGVCAVAGAGGELASRPVRPAGAAARPPWPEDDAWIIFTSGTTGTPKGVAVTHRSAAALVDAEARLFLRGHPLGPGDRVLAGLSVAFDASCEEMWLAWRHGACLVPAPRSVVKTGPELVTWLARRRISVISTVPTLASLWPADFLHGVRLLILGGEVCPAGLADRLTGRGTEVWNTYGPTEATVVTCAARLSGGAVRIGLPLDGWRVAVVDPDSGRPVPWGEIGELVIGGAGVARYLDRDKDAVSFAPLAGLGWERAFRSGDLVRAEPDGLIYVCRTDTQVKIRGYRIELSEIEAVLMQQPGIRQSAVATYEPQPGVVELAAYYRPRDSAVTLDRQAIYAALRDRLPRHMLPAYLVQLLEIPLLPNGKTDRRHLPPPDGSHRVGAGQAYTAPATAGEQALAGTLAELLGLERVSVDAEFFDDLGMSSLLVAHFCARVRERAQAPPVSSRAVYLHPTIRSLAAAVTGPAAVPGGAASPPAPGRVWRAGTAQYLACGALQLLAFLAVTFLAAAAVSAAFNWLSGTSSLAGIYLRSLAFTAAAFIVLSGVPILAKWTLIGRWKPAEIRVWTLPYLRFWLVKTLIRADPLAFFGGSPVYSLYLRALGARIGRRVVILSRSVPVCTDMLTIGDDTVIRRNCSFTGYRADSGVIRTGPVTIGNQALIGEHTLLDIGTGVGNGSQLGHASSLQESQAVPDGQCWHGSPAQPASVNYRRAQPLPSGRVRRVAYGTVQMATLLLVTMPLAVAAAVAALIKVPAVSRLAATDAGNLVTAAFYQEGLVVSAALFIGTILLGAAVVLTVPRVLARFITPGRAYPLYGLRHWMHRAIRRLTNIKFYLELMGDSSFAVGYLRALGYRMRDVEQTGSNFGADLAHETPFLVDIGRGTMVADGATFINADYSSTSFCVTPLSIGPHNFLGNAVAYPAGARTGENCLIATKAMVPLDGPVQDNVGLLGSPCFQIPRSATTDDRFDYLRTGEEFRRRLRAKNRHNLATMGLFLAVRWVHLFIITLLAMAAWGFYGGHGALVLAGLTIVTLLFSLAYFIAVERALLRFGSLRPQYCSIYDPYFWWHERYWKLMAPLLGMFNGTPFKSPVWRLTGVRVGRRVFDDGCSIAERTLVTIGDYCTLNSGSVIQCHSMEDGIFKADYTLLEDECTLGTGALVHYGVTMGDGARLAPDSFLMKGEKVPPHEHWGGNPARPL
jgi:non-ribosomal peptide synthetase-like protein